jgi:hypothetical protein
VRIDRLQAASRQPDGTTTEADLKYARPDVVESRIPEAESNKV